MTRPIATVLALVIAGPAFAQPALKYDTPKGWTSQPPTSGMRVAQFVLPKAEGDPEDGTAVIFFFGKGEGGGVNDNLDRWAGQMVQADGKPGTRAQAKTAAFMANGLKVTTLDISGTYSAGGMMGGGGPKPNSRMKAAVIESPNGNYFVRVLGPQKTIAKWDASAEQFFKSVHVQ
jgi:hypothetical protein